MAGCSGDDNNPGAGGRAGGAPDTTAPTVSSTVPADAATGVAINQNINATRIEQISSEFNSIYDLDELASLAVVYRMEKATFTPGRGVKKPSAESDLSVQ
jgi:Big-like domain-containing protein